MPILGRNALGLYAYAPPDEEYGDTIEEHVLWMSRIGFYITPPKEES